MNRIPQRSQYDCGVAAMAMLYDMTYEAAADALRWDGRMVSAGTYQVDILWHGLRLGIPVALLAPREVYAKAGWDSADRLLAPDGRAFWDFLHLRPAVLSVDSLTTPGNGHAVAWDGRYLIDPLYKRHPAGGHYKVDDRPVIYDAVVRLDQNKGTKP